MKFARGRLPLPAFFLIWYGPARDKEMIMGKKKVNQTKAAISNFIFS